MIIIPSLCLIWTTLLATASCSCELAVPDQSFKLSGLNMNFPCPSTRSIYLQTGRYVPQNVIATRMQIHNDEAFVTLPRYKHGVPFTLAKFSLNAKGCKPTLTPYPCWNMQEEGNCEALQSAVDIFICPLGILWVLDIGLVNTLEQPVRRCGPKIVAINLKTGQVVKVVDLTPLALPTSRLQYLQVDYTVDGRPFVYVTDGGAGAIIVYDVVRGKGFRVVLPAACTQTKKDVLYFTLVRKQCGTYIYFSYLSSQKVYAVLSSALMMGQTSGAITEAGTKPGDLRNGVLLGTDGGSGIIFRYRGDPGIYLWNAETCLKTENFVLLHSGNECRLPMQVVPGYKNMMWSIESNFYDYIAGTAGCMGPSMVVQPVIKECDGA